MFYFYRILGHLSLICILFKISQALLKRGWIEVAVGRSGSHRVHSSLSHAAAIRHAKEHHGGERHRALGYGNSHENNSHSNCTSGPGQGGRSSSMCITHSINLVYIYL